MLFSKNQNVLFQRGYYEHTSWYTFKKTIRIVPIFTPVQPMILFYRHLSTLSRKNNSSIGHQCVNYLQLFPINYCHFQLHNIILTITGMHFTAWTIFISMINCYKMFKKHFKHFLNKPLWDFILALYQKTEAV